MTAPLRLVRPDEISPDRRGHIATIAADINAVTAMLELGAADLSAGTIRETIERLREATAVLALLVDTEARHGRDD